MIDFKKIKAGDEIEVYMDSYPYGNYLTKVIQNNAHSTYIQQMNLPKRRFKVLGLRYTFNCVVIHITDPTINSVSITKIESEMLESVGGKMISTSDHPGKMIIGVLPNGIVNHYPSGSRSVIIPSKPFIACSNCEGKFEFAEPNQPNGSLICWSCKKDPYRCRY